MLNAQTTAVIILNYFGCHDTRVCVESLLRQTQQVCVFIVDNSADACEKRRLATSVEHMPGVCIIAPRSNLGFARGVNLGLKTARALGHTRFLVLNNDTVLHPGAWDILEASYDRFPESLITPTIQWANRTNSGNYYHPFLGLIRTQVNLKSTRPWVFYVAGCALAFDAAFLDRTGWLDERFFMYGEDVEYSARAARLGMPIRVLDTILLSHTGSKSSKPASLFYEYHINRSHLLLCFRLFDRPLCRWLSLGMKLPVLLSRAGFRSILHRTPHPMLGLFLSPLKIRIRPRMGN